MLKDLLDKRHTLSPTQVFIVYGLIIALFLGYQNMVYTPRSRLIRDKQDELDQITMSLARSEVELAELDRLNRELDQIQAEAARFDLEIPEYILQEDVLRHLSSLASMSGVTIQTVSFSSPQPYAARGNADPSTGVALRVLPVSLTLSGSWTNLHTFFAVLFAFPEGMVRVDGFQTSASSDGDDLNLQTTLLYFYRGGDAA